MEITIEVLDRYLQDFREQHQKLTMQLNAIGGAIQILEMLKKQLLLNES